MKRTTAIDLDAEIARVAKTLRRRAFEAGIFDGTLLRKHVIDACTYTHSLTRTRIIFTRDVGHHSSGWWKNPDYERCFHLSLSPFPPLVMTPGHVAELDNALTVKWVRAFFGEHAPKAWWEPAYSSIGKKNSVWHFRVFVDIAWEPIAPRGEVYSRELTEAGWKSASDVLAFEDAAEAERREREGNEGGAP